MSDAPTITAIKNVPSDPHRVSVRVGKKSVAKLPREAVSEIGLVVGERWTEALAARVEQAAGLDKMKRDALRLVNRRDYSSGELVFKLTQKDHPRSLAQALVDEFAERGLIDDEAYGRSVIRTELSRKAAGRRLLQQKLYQKKLPRDLIETLLNAHDADEDHDDITAATELAEKKLATATLQKCDAQKRRQRIYSLLARRGFGPDVINKVMAAVGEQLRDNGQHGD